MVQKSSRMCFGELRVFLKEPLPKLAQNGKRSAQKNAKEENQFKFRLAIFATFLSKRKLPYRSMVRRDELPVIGRDNIAIPVSHTTRGPQPSG